MVDETVRLLCIITWDGIKFLELMRARREEEKDGGCGGFRKGVENVYVVHESMTRQGMTSRRTSSANVNVTTSSSSSDGGCYYEQQ